LPPGWLGRVNKFCNEVLPIFDQDGRPARPQQNFLERTEGVGVITKEMHYYGITGGQPPRSGIDADLRKDNPYSGYEQYEFDVPSAPRRLLRPYLVHGGDAPERAHRPPGH